MNCKFLWLDCNLSRTAPPVGVLTSWNNALLIVGGDTNNGGRNDMMYEILLLETITMGKDGL